MRRQTEKPDAPLARGDHVLVVTVSTGPVYRGARGRALYVELYARFGTLPGVQSVSISTDTPPAGELSMCMGTGPRSRVASSRTSQIDVEAAPHAVERFS
jgi:hypothetical protein